MASNYDFNPHNLPDDFLRAIGLSISSAAQTERCVDDLIGACANIDVEVTGSITTHMSVPLRMTILRSLAQIRLDDLGALDELDRIIGELERAFAKRNDLAHCEWAREPTTNEIFLLKRRARDGFEMTLVPATVETIKGDAALIYDAGMAIIEFMRKHRLKPTYPPGRRSGGEKTKAARKNRGTK